MIWLRRILAIPVGFLFTVTFVMALLLSHLSGTVGSAGFYNGQMSQAHVYDWVYDNLTPTILDETGAESPTEFPIDTPEFKKDIVTVVEQTFPPKWLQGTFENATSQMFPYFVGDKDSFTITIAVKDRIDPMVDGIDGVIDNHEAEIYDYVTNDLVVPALTEQLSQGATLPYGITLTDEEISDVVAQSMPQEQEDVIGWFKEMISGMAAYVKGDVNDLNLVIDLTDVKLQANTAIHSLVEQKLRNAYDSIQMTCTEAEFRAEVSNNPDTLPSCKPAGYSYEQFKQVLETRMGMTFAQAVDQEVVSHIPSSYQFNDEQMRETLGEDMANTLDDVRDFVATDQGRITDQDFQKSDDNQTASDGADKENFDKARHTIHTFKMLIPVFWLVSILLLVGIGFLCGRNWKSRLLSALGTLFVTSLIFVIVVAVVYAVAPIPDRLVERPEGADATQVGIVMADKADEMVHNAINALVWGLEVKLIICIVVSALAVAGVIVWTVVDRRRRRSSGPIDPSSPPA